MPGNDASRRGTFGQNQTFATQAEFAPKLTFTKESMGEFVVTSEREAKLRFHSRRYQRQGSLVSYDVTLEGHRFSATARVGNSELGTSPVVLFNEMVAEPSGWEGEKSWAALDGEMSMVAITDSLGHVNLEVNLDPRDGPPEWYVRLTMVLEVRSLEQLAAEAGAFFGQQEVWR